jgi:O-antigen/teichoic acid export membrane protein
VAISALEWILNRRYITPRLQRLDEAGSIQIHDLWQTARQVGSLAVGVFLGVFVSQLDRIILSRTVELEQFGRYVVVAQLGLAFLQLQYPLMRALFPSIVVGNTGTTSGPISNRTLGLAVLGVGIFPALLLATFSQPVLMIWTRDASIAAQGALPLSFIGIAVAFNSLFNIAYIHMVKRSAFRVLIACYCSAGIIIILIIPECAKAYGIMAGGLSWLVFCSVQLLFGGWWWLREKSNLRGSM